MLQAFRRLRHEDPRQLNMRKLLVMVGIDPLVGHKVYISVDQANALVILWIQTLSTNPRIFCLQTAKGQGTCSTCSRC